MSEKEKGFSLRKKQNRQRGIPTEIKDGRPSESSKPSKGRPSADGGDDRQPRPRPRNRQASQTADMVRKRYSIRYNQLAEPGDAPPIPGMPSIPPQFGGGQEGRSEGRREGAPQPSGAGVDKRALQDPNLQADQYISSFLGNASEQEIAEYKQSLKKVKNRASSDLQNNVYQNRTQFIKISKEAEKLKQEMQSLRGLMAEMTTTLSQSASSIESNDVTSPALDGGRARNRANRSSLANLEAMWNIQLQALWKNIEGSQKFLAAIPGRHIITENGHWIELDSATWKSKRGVHIVLLNDHLLVAARKPKRMDTNDPRSQRAHTKLVAQRCWPLQEIDLVDVAYDAKQIGRKDLAKVQDAVTVRHGNESFTFRSDRGSAKDKNDLITAFRRALDELQRAERKDKDSRREASGGGPDSNKRNGINGQENGESKPKDTGKVKHQQDMLIDVDGKQRNLRWVDGQIDELDIEIAGQRFEEAVGRVEQLRKLAKSLKGNAIAQEIITSKVDERVSKLADILTQNLVATHNQLTPTQSHVAHLARLDFSSRARHAYLAARTATIQQRARQIVFEGDVLSYVTQLAYVYFTLMRNSIEVFTQCFPAAATSAVVVWAKAELDKFNAALGRALGGVERRGDVWKEGLARSRELASGLQEVGVDFEGMVGTGLD